MSAAKGRSPKHRLEDVLVSIAAIGEHRKRGDIHDPLVFDAVRMRLVEIGEAINALPFELLDSEADIPWKEVIGMRHKLAHHYFDTAKGIVAATVEDDLPLLEAAITRMISRLS